MRAQITYGLLFLAVGCQCAAINKCHVENLDTCGEPLKQFRKELGQKFPTTEAHVEQLCTQLSKSEKCFQEYKGQCMTSMQSEMLALMTEGMYEVYNEFCSSGSEIRTDYLKNADCMNNAFESDDFKKLSTYVEASLEEMLEKEKSEQLVSACCGYQWLDLNSRNLGAEKCGKDAVDSFLRVAQMAASNLPEVLCQGFDPEGEVCKAALPAPDSKPKGTIKSSHLAKTFTALYLE